MRSVSELAGPEREWDGHCQLREEWTNNSRFDERNWRDPMSIYYGGLVADASLLEPCGDGTDSDSAKATRLLLNLQREAWHQISPLSPAIIEAHPGVNAVAGSEATRS